MTKIIKEKQILPLEINGSIIRYPMTNDYMFRAVLQKNIIALKYLIACLLSIAVECIVNIEIMNPIKLGEAIDEKTCILDLKILLNNNKILNLEMQVSDQGNWPERSLYYLSRAFSNLKRGASYINVLPCIHIGILNFSLFPDSPEFYAEYLMKNTKNDKVYSDKFAIHVLDLTQIETDKVKKGYPDLYYWAKLFVANTWEEIQMLSEKSEGIHEAALTLRKLSADEKIRMQCEAREMYEHDMASAIHKGRTEGKIEDACNMLKKGYPISDICEITGLSEDDIHNLT